MEFTLFPTVSSIAQRNIVFARLEDTLQDASGLMHDHNVSSVIVRRQDSINVFSVEDLLGCLQHGGSMSQSLAELPLRKVTTILEQEHVLAALELLDEKSSRYLAVVNNDAELVGIITYTNILAAIDPAVLIERKTIGDLISKSEPVTFTQDWILEDVLCHLNKMEDSIIVVESAVPIGIITTKDIFGLISEGKSTSHPLSEYMASPVITTSVSASIHETFMLMKAHQIKRAVVVDEIGRVIGVVPQSQLISFAYSAWIDLMKHHAGELKELVAILEEKARSLEKSTLTDPLTELGNRRRLYQRIADEMERMRRYQTPAFSMVLLDIDFFKKVNDMHGHLAGDEVLKGVAQILRSMIRQSDEAIRWGGEEFAILLPHTNLEHAVGFANRLRSRVEESVLVGQISVTISAGVGEFSLDEKQNAFFERIDQALYQAKRAGRNRVEFSLT